MQFFHFHDEIDKEKLIFISEWKICLDEFFITFYPKGTVSHFELFGDVISLSSFL
jgi:hypothetical protein